MRKRKSTPRHELYLQLGKRIRKARKEADITQTELASAIALSRTSVTNIESGRQQILLHTLYNIASVLGKDVVELLPENKQQRGEDSVDSILTDLDAAEREWVESLLSKTKIGR